MRNARPTFALPIGALVLDSVGALMAAGGLLAVFVPEALPAAFAGMLTPAVGWTAFGVGATLSAVASWGIVQAVRARQQR